MSGSPPKKNAAYILYVGLVSQADTKLLKANPTLATGDFQVSIDGGTLNNLATLPTVTPASGKMVKISLSAAEMNGDNITVVCSDAAGAEWCDLLVNIQTSTRQIDDLAYPATSGRSMVVDASGIVDANAVKVGPTGAGTAQTAGDLATAIAGVQSDTDNIQTRLPAALVSGRMDASVGADAVGLATASVLTAVKAKTDLIPAAPAAVGDIPTATQNADALLKRDLSAVTGEAARSVINAVRKLMNKWAISGSTLTVYKEDDATAAFTQTITSVADAEPVTGLDTVG